MSEQAITEEWLKTAGFKWHQSDRQPDKHWLLWLGSAIPGLMTCYEDLGIEVAPGRRGSWFCWLRGDSAGRYHRFIHIRHIENTAQLVRLIEALTGQDWDVSNNIGGSMTTPDQAERIRDEWDRLDRRIRRDASKWSSVEKDDTRGRALPEHLEAHAKSHHGEPHPTDGKE